MDRPQSPARLPALNPVFLVQTDTTVGFACKAAAPLIRIKQRAPEKPFLKTFPSLSAYDGRVPNRFKNRVRRASGTTFVVKNQAFRIVRSGPYHRLITRFGWLYSTSANRSGGAFERDFAVWAADVVIEDGTGLFEAAPSQIRRLGRTRQRRLR